MTATETAIRNGGLNEISELLQTQRVTRHDLIINSPAILAQPDGTIRLTNAAQDITEDGATTCDGIYTPNRVALEGMASRVAGSTWPAKVHEDRPDVWAQIINGMLHGSDATFEKHPETGDPYPVNPGKWMARILRSDDTGQRGILRAFLSNSFKAIDNLDWLLALLDGMAKGGLSPANSIFRCDLTDRRMYVKVTCPQIATNAGALLRGYRNPYEGAGADQFRRWQQIARTEGMGFEPGSEPVVWAGLVASCSDVGEGSASLKAHLTVKVCKNGLTLPVDAFALVHRGRRQEEGIIDWSADTREKELALVTAQARDSVQRFLDPAWVQAQVDSWEHDAATPVTDAPKVIKAVLPAAGIPKDRADDILGFFIRGGQTTAGGIAQAVTAAAQVEEDADLAHKMEAAFVPVLRQAAELARK